VPVHSFREAVFPNIQPEPPLEHLEAIPSCLMTIYTREEADPQLTATSLQVVIESNRVIPAPSAVHHEACAPDPSPALLPISEHIPGPQCPSCS